MIGSINDSLTRKLSNKLTTFGNFFDGISQFKEKMFK